MHLALAFVTSRPFVSSNIIGATTMKQLDACLASADVINTFEVEAAINVTHQVHQTRRLANKLATTQQDACVKRSSFIELRAKRPKSGRVIFVALI